MSRSTAGHRIVNAGSFVLPLLPVMLIFERYEHGVFEVGSGHTPACLPLYYQRPDLLGEADKWTKEALRLAPQAITLKGTRGLRADLNWESGRGNGAPARGWPGERTPLDHAISAAYLAKAHHLRGETADMLRCLEKAKSPDVDHRLVTNCRRVGGEGRRQKQFARTSLGKMTFCRREPNRA